MVSWYKYNQSKSFKYDSIDTAVIKVVYRRNQTFNININIKENLNFMKKCLNNLMSLNSLQFMISNNHKEYDFKLLFLYLSVKQFVINVILIYKINIISLLKWN